MSNNLTISSFPSIVTADANGNISNIAVGNLNLTGNVTANYLLGNGYYLSGLNIPQSYSNANVANYLPVYGGNILAGNISLTGNINSLNVTNDFTTGTSNTISNASVGNFTVRQNALVLGNLSIQGTLTTINSNTITINDKSITLANNATTPAEANGAGIDINGANVTFQYDVISNSMVLSHTLQSSNLIISQGNLDAAGNINVTNNALVSGNVSASYLLGNGYYLTGLNIPQSYSNANVANYLPVYGGNILFGNLSATNDATNEIRITRGTLPEQGTIITGNGVYVGSGVPFSNLAAAAIRLEVIGGNATANNFIATSNVLASYFLGNGAFLTGLPAGYSNADVANYLPTYTGNISANNANFSGYANVLGNVNALANLVVTDNAYFSNNTFTTGNSNVTGNVNALSNLIVTNNVYFNSNTFTTGRANVTGNINAAANLYVGNSSANTGNVIIYGNSTTDSNTTGALQVAGGISTQGNIWVEQGARIGGVGTNRTKLGNQPTLVVTAGGNVLGNSRVQQFAEFSSSTWGLAQLSIVQSNTTPSLINITVPFGETMALGKLDSSTGNIAAALTVNASSSLSDPGNITIASNLIVTNNAYFRSNTFTTGNANITANVYALGNLLVGANATIGANLSVLNTLFVGNTSNNTTFINPVIIGRGNASGYNQLAILNDLNTASSDLVAYADNGSDAGSWADMGFTGSAFSDGNYTITKPNDGYFFTQGNIGFGSNLVIATGPLGINKDIVFAANGFQTINERMRFVSASNSFVPISNTTINLGNANRYYNNVYSSNTYVLSNVYVGNSTLNNSYVIIGSANTANSGLLIQKANTERWAVIADNTSIQGNLLIRANGNANIASFNSNVNANFPAEVQVFGNLTTIGSLSDYVVANGANLTNQTVAFGLDIYSASLFRTSKYVVQVSANTGAIESREILVVNNGTTAVLTSYGIVYTGTGPLVSYDATVTSGNVFVTGTVLSSATSVSIRVFPTYIRV